VPSPSRVATRREAQAILSGRTKSKVGPFGPT